MSQLRWQIWKAKDENYTEVGFATTTLEELLVAEDSKAKLRVTVVEYKEDDKAYNLADLHKSLEQID